MRISERQRGYYKLYKKTSLSKHKRNNSSGRDEGFDQRGSGKRPRGRPPNINYPLNTLQSDPELDLDEGDDEDLDLGEETESDDESGLGDDSDW